MQIVDRFARAVLQALQIARIKHAGPALSAQPEQCFTRLHFIDSLKTGALQQLWRAR